MFRRLLPPLALLAALVGCTKKPPEDDGKTVGLGDEEFIRQHNVQLRDRKAGDKFEVTETHGGTTKETRDFGDNKVETEEHSGTTKYVYTEEYLEVPAPGAVPTKARRVYSVAERTDDGVAAKDVPIRGKTVLIQKGTPRYEFRVDNLLLVESPDLIHIERLYNPVQEQSKATDLLPGRPVRMHESWDLDKEKVARYFVPPGMRLDPATTATGKLVRPYAKGERQFGEITYDLNLVLLDNAQPGPGMRLQPGSTAKWQITFDGCIDGNSSDAEVKIRITVDTIFRWEGDLPPGAKPPPREDRFHTEEHAEISTKMVP
jgi:hypothetical protein